MTVPRNVSRLQWYGTKQGEPDPMRASRYPNVGVLVVAVAALAWGVACDVPPPTAPTNPSAPARVSVEIVGPDTLAPGQSAQFTAMVLLSDGTRKIGSPAEIQWSSNFLILQVDDNGVATAQDRVGDTTLFARLLAGRVSSTGTPPPGVKVITIVPEGTFRMIGRVSDAEAPSVPLSGALVEVTPGALVTTTDLQGQYRLYGVPPATTVRVTKPGFQLVERTVQLTAHATQDFGLLPDAPRPVLSGPYTLAIDVGSGCTNAGIPEEIRHRRYDAVLTQNGGLVDVTLTEPRFRVNSIGRGKGFSGIAYSGGATFTLRGFDPEDGIPDPMDYPNVVEQLPDSTVLIPWGTVIMTGDAAGLTGQLAGFFPRFGATFPAQTTEFFGGCQAQSPITFTLTPR